MIIKQRCRGPVLIWAQVFDCFGAQIYVGSHPPRGAMYRLVREADHFSRRRPLFRRPTGTAAGP